MRRLRVDPAHLVTTPAGARCASPTCAPGLGTPPDCRRSPHHTHWLCWRAAASDRLGPLRDGPSSLQPDRRVVKLLGRRVGRTPDGQRPIRGKTPGFAVCKPISRAGSTPGSRGDGGRDAASRFGGQALLALRGPVGLGVGLHHGQARVVVREFVQVRPRDLGSQDHVVVSDVRLWIPGAVLELDIRNCSTSNGDVAHSRPIRSPAARACSTVKCASSLRPQRLLKASHDHARNRARRGKPAQSHCPEKQARPQSTPRRLPRTTSRS